jgi:predicted dehydrogenase
MKENHKMKIGIVGCGKVVIEHYIIPLRKLIKDKAIEISVLIDKNQESIKYVGRKLNCKNFFTNLEDALASNRIDALIIASPISYHTEHILTALKYGCHVLCEKPMTNNVIDAELIYNKSIEYNKIVSIAMARRFFPNLIEVKRMIENGALGTNITFELREGGFYSWPIASDVSFKRESSKGGVLLDSGAHTLDILFWFFGTGRVLEHHDDAWKNGVETNSISTIEFENARGIFQLSWDSQINNIFKITGSEKTILIKNDDINHYFEINKNDEIIKIKAKHQWPNTVIEKENPTKSTPIIYHDCFYLQLVSFLRAIKFNEKIEVDSLSALKVVRAVEESYSKSIYIKKDWISNSANIANKINHWLNN